MSKIEAVIFDWAGTTVDYGCFAPVQAFAEAFQSFGITPTDEEIRKPMGMLKWDHVHTMLQMSRIAQAWEEVHGKPWTKEDVDAVYRKSESAIFDILHQFAVPKPYVLETIAALRQKNIKIGSTTGYTDDMMAIVAPKAAENGYQPDAWFSPNAVNNMGRPYPFMIFKNLAALNISSVRTAIKVGDTVADIKEGKNAGMLSVGIVEGSSVMGLREAEYAALSAAEKQDQCQRVRKVYADCGADFILQNMSELCPLLAMLG